jgi:hypothetical protein
MLQVSLGIEQPSTPGGAVIGIAVAVGPAGGDEQLGESQQVDGRALLPSPGEISGRGNPVLGNDVLLHSLPRARGSERFPVIPVSLFSVISLTGGVGSAVIPVVSVTGRGIKRDIAGFGNQLVPAGSHAAVSAPAMFPYDQA